MESSSKEGIISGSLLHKRLETYRKEWVADLEQAERARQETKRAKRSERQLKKRVRELEKQLEETRKP
jgi:hypothetical protein